MGRHEEIEHTIGAKRVMVWDATAKVWMYRNDAAPGMTIDTSVTDRVLALKGGSQDYNVNGGSDTGDVWTHTHTGSASVGNAPFSSAMASGGENVSTFDHTHSVTITVNANTEFRPSAAVGTMQYPDV